MRICVHGLGYVGLATAALFANNDHEVIGYDTDDAVVEKLENRQLDLPEEPFQAYVERSLDRGLSLSANIVRADYHLICVPTPYDDGPNLRYVEQASSGIADSLGPGETVIVESTVPPRTTVETVAPLLESSGLTAGEDFQVAYAPETILPGNTVTELVENDRIVGGITDDAARRARELYEPVIDGSVYTARNATTAELVKLSQNAFRDVNVAFANELARLADDYEVDVLEAVQLANTHPRVDVLNPGPGVGGHCLPVDPLFLTDGSDRARLVETAREVNDGMPSHVVQRLREELGSLTGKTIAVLGVAYKGNVAETRNSPGLAVARALEAAPVSAEPIADGGHGTVSVRLSDPHVTESFLEISPLPAALRSADAAVITAAHDEYGDLDPAAVASHLEAGLVLDTVDILDRERWESTDVRVTGLTSAGKGARGYPEATLRKTEPAGADPVPQSRTTREPDE